MFVSVRYGLYFFGEEMHYEILKIFDIYIKFIGEKIDFLFYR